MKLKSEVSMSDININMRPFVLPKTEYTRDGDPVMKWIEAQTDYISKLYDYPKEYIRNWIKEQMKEGGLCPFFDRKVKFIHQTSLGNREQKEGSFTSIKTLLEKKTMFYLLLKPHTRTLLNILH